MSKPRAGCPLNTLGMSSSLLQSRVAESQVRTRHGQEKVSCSPRQMTGTWSCKGAGELGYLDSWCFSSQELIVTVVFHLHIVVATSGAGLATQLLTWRTGARTAQDVSGISSFSLLQSRVDSQVRNTGNLPTNV